MLIERTDESEGRVKGERRGRVEGEKYGEGVERRVEGKEGKVEQEGSSGGGGVSEGERET